MKIGKQIMLTILVASFVIGGAIYMTKGGPGPTFTTFGAPTGTGQPDTTGLGACNNGQVTTTTTKVFLKNGEDDTADTPFNATVYFFGSKGDYQTGSVTDGIGTTATLNCGETYTMRAVTSDGNRLDNAEITAADGAVRNADGSATFTPTAANHYIRAVGSFHGVVEFRVYNVDNAGWRYKVPLGNTNAFQLTGATVNGTTSENSTVTVAAGLSMTDEIHFRANESVTDASDFGYYILVDAGAAVWNEPTLRLDGAVLSKLPNGLPGDENRLWGATYEYAFKVDGKITDSEHVLKTEFKALSGVNPDEDDSPTVAIAALGAFKTTSGTSVKIAAATDASSAAAVYTIQTVKLALG